MKTRLLLITLALAASTSTACAQTLLFRDGFSNPNLSGWERLWAPPFPAGLSNLNQQVLVWANCGPMQTNNPMNSHFPWGHQIPMPSVLSNNWTLEMRGDLVSANQNDAWASMHFLWSPLGGSGYVFFVDQDEVALMKFWNGIGSKAVFFYEQRQVKSQNVTLVLRVTRRDANLVIHTRILDNDHTNAVVFERTVTDTPQVDRTLPNRSVRGIPLENDVAGEAWRLVSGPGYVEVTLDWVNSSAAPTGAAQVIYDNIEAWLYESPRPNVVVWGGSEFGEANVPSGLTNAVAVAAGGATSLALRVDGTVASWGGFFPVGEVELPTDLSNVVALAASGTALDISPLGCHAMFLRADGTVSRWDTSHYPPQTYVPPGLSDVVALAPGAGHCLVLRADGTVVAWGENAEATNVPSGLSNVVAVASGWAHCLALRAEGTVVAWGYSAFTNVPVGLSNVVAVAAGFQHSLALRADGTVVAWGGTGAHVPEYGGTNVPAGLTNVVAVAAGHYQSLALRADGTVVAWPPDLFATDVPSGQANVAAVAGGFYQSLGLIGDGPPVVQASLCQPTIDTNGFSVSLPTQSGRVYALEYKNSLADAEWTRLPLVAGTGHERRLTDPNAAGSRRFYRVRGW